MNNTPAQPPVSRVDGTKYTNNYHKENKGRGEQRQNSVSDAVHGSNSAMENDDLLPMENNSVDLEDFAKESDAVITLLPVELGEQSENWSEENNVAFLSTATGTGQPSFGFESFDEAQRYAVGCLVVNVLSNLLNVGLQVIVYSSSSQETIRRTKDKIQDDKHFANRFSTILLDALGLKEEAKQAILCIPSLCLESERVEDTLEETKIHCVNLLGDMSNRFCAIQALVQVAICRGKYDSRARVILQRTCSQLSIEWNKFAMIEMALAVQLIETHPISEHDTEQDDAEEQERTIAPSSSYQQQIDDAVEDAWDEEDARHRIEKLRTRRRRIRALKIGGITVAGGVVFGLTGGLIAPLLLPALAAMGLASAGTLAGTTMGTTIVGSLFGAGGAALTGKKARRRTSSRVKEFLFERADGMDPNRDEEEGGSAYSYTPGLHVCIAIPGWLGKSGSRPGSCAAIFASDLEELLPCSERFALRWESKRLKQMGRAFAKFWASKTAQTLAQQAVTQLGGVFSLIAGAFLAAIAWPLTVVSVMDYIDNPWSQLISRADGAGDTLADVLAERCHGNRPVTLVGFSLGARVVFKCLLSLADRRCFGVVDHAFLIGAPVTGSPSQWKKAKAAVGGRLVNAYCGTDWALTFFHRGMANSATSVAGIRRVRVTMKAQVSNNGTNHFVNDNETLDNVKDRSISIELVENVDLAAIGVQGHKDYRNLLRRILECVGIGSGHVSLPPAVVRSKSLSPNWIDEDLESLSRNHGKKKKSKFRSWKTPTEEQWQQKHKEMGTNADALLIAGDDDEELAQDRMEVNKDDPWNYQKESKQNNSSKWNFTSFTNLFRKKKKDENLVGNQPDKDSVTMQQSTSDASHSYSNNSEDEDETNLFIAKKLEYSTIRRMVDKDTGELLMLDTADDTLLASSQSNIDALLFEEEPNHCKSDKPYLSKDTPKVEVISIEQGGIPIHVGCEVAGGRFARFFCQGTKPPARRSQVFTTFGDGQTAVDIRVHGSGRLRNKARLMPLLGHGELILSKSVRDGKNTFVWVIFEITERGGLWVTANELGSGWENSQPVQSEDIVGSIQFFISAEKLAEERNKQRYDAAIMIQSTWRRYIARKIYLQLKEMHSRNRTLEQSNEFAKMET
ncbi:Uncharacterized membrane protein [Galdieria sulphuraria]|uniref:Transmembrane and coiled-coil domain-containing protein 4 n=1 Tax=Galdieria sulphuraria TaxID=130081 RepID=M2VT75_GALSU|nr:uncharacterized protein Gasu_59840 [Galdieria sulphuraria]EME26366.1 hypothetical protein Gasu_59840 [Galdieria sulphuraria]GJD11667.1 Uncharacterized membrane protein [Galdieria sulphuraria]|eukprot:XP_005702886.1 hypothetical protein Gasu_59840 [Galdieria sulphuraria]